MRRLRRFLFALAAVGLGGLLLALAPAGPPGPSVFPERHRPIVFAHRGGGGEAPEATLAAMRGVTAADPATAIELDVRRSRDGHIVVIHDATVERTTNGRGQVADLTLAELQALDAGYCATPGRGTGTARRGACAQPGDYPFRGKGYRIPTLAEVLAALPAGTLIGIEVKAAGFEEPLARLLRDSGRLPRIVVGSGHGDVADRLRALLPEAAHFFPPFAGARLALAAKLTSGRLAWPDFQVLAAPPSALGLRLDTAGMLAAARASGVLVAYFTVNDEVEMERLLRLGADALMTDYPARARRVLERLRSAGEIGSGRAAAVR